MKNTLKNIGLLFSFTLLTFIVSCEKSDDLINNDIAGTYEGTLTIDLGKKTDNSKTTNNIATAIVSMVGDQIEVHCFGDNFDTTIMLDIYENGSDISVCLTGTEFENMYGHMVGQSNMNGNMQNMDSEWMQHLNNDHQSGDEHFGGFDMQHHSFNYTFTTDHGNYHFEGTKK